MTTAVVRRGDAGSGWPFGSGMCPLIGCAYPWWSWKCGLWWALSLTAQANWLEMHRHATREA